MKLGSAAVLEKKNCGNSAGVERFLLLEVHAKADLCLFADFVSQFALLKSIAVSECGGMCGGAGEGMVVRDGRTFLEWPRLVEGVVVSCVYFYDPN